jgi:sRNA-binding carbon storage regulator CsrA
MQGTQGLILTRAAREAFWIGPDIRIEVVRCGREARLHVVAPLELRIVREELLPDGHHFPENSQAAARFAIPPAGHHFPENSPPAPGLSAAPEAA